MPLFSPFLPHKARRTPCMILPLPMHCTAAVRGGRAASLLSVFTQSRGRLTTAFGLSLTSRFRLKTVYSLWTLPYPDRISGLRVSAADWWSCPFHGALLLGDCSRNQQYVFLPLPASFLRARSRLPLPAAL